jgi:hypothetical protein
MSITFRQWLVCLKHYGLMCLFLSSPERLPYNPVCIRISLFCYFLLGILLIDEQRGYAVICSQIILELVILAAITYIGLKLKASLSRFQQTFSALLGTSMLLSPIYQVVANNGGSQAEGNSLLLYVTLLIIFWNLAILSLIFKRSLEISTPLAAMLSFNYFLVYQFVVAGIY